MNFEMDGFHNPEYFMYYNSSPIFIQLHLLVFI